MPNPDVIVFSRPDFDSSVIDGLWWLESVLDYCVKRGITVVDLVGDLATKAEINQALQDYDPTCFIGVGHGSADLFTAQNREVVFETCNCDQLAGRAAFLQSCRTAVNLGPDIITKGGIVYAGYIVSYTWIVLSDIEIPTRLCDRCYKTTQSLPSYLYVNNGRWDKCFAAKKALTELWIEFWETQDTQEHPYLPEEMAAEIIKWLRHDEIDEPDSAIYGDGSFRRKLEVTHIPVVQAICLPRVQIDKPFRIAIIVTCPEGCDLRGQKVQLIDEYGNIVTEKTLTRFHNGVCSTELFETTYAMPGRFLWTARFTGTATHPTSDSVPLHFVLLHPDYQEWDGYFGSGGWSLLTIPPVVGGRTHLKFWDPPYNDVRLTDDTTIHYWDQFQQVEAIPDEGYKFVRWIIDGNPNKVEELAKWVTYDVYNPVLICHMRWHKHLKPIFLPEEEYILNVSTEPAIRVPVKIDDVLIGETPLSTTISSGNHKISVPEEFET